MVEVHTLDAWLSPEVRAGAVHDVLRMLGGFAAPSFLFMAGLSQVLGDSALERRGVPLGARRARALRRALWLLGVAYAFRAAEYVLGGMFRVRDGWQDLFRVDILNVIALGLAACVLLLGTPRRVHVACGALAALAVALATPLIAAWRHEPSRLLDYLYATYPRANFSLFAWAGFLFAGSAVGRLVLDRDRPGMLLGAGAAIFAIGFASDLLPPVYAHQDFWQTSPSWWAMRLGGVVVLTGALQLLPLASDRLLSALRTLGRHSLLGYIASIELTYGFVSTPLHRVLSLGAVLVGIAGMIVVTWALSAVADRIAAARRRPPADAGGAVAAAP